MQAVFVTISKIILSMLSSLMTEKFIKWVVVYLLEIIVKQTETQRDDELLERAKKEWGV